MQLNDYRYRIFILNIYETIEPRPINHRLYSTFQLMVNTKSN